MSTLSDIISGMEHSVKQERIEFDKAILSISSVEKDAKKWDFETIKGFLERLYGVYATVADSLHEHEEKLLKKLKDMQQYRVALEQISQHYDPKFDDNPQIKIAQVDAAFEDFVVRIDEVLSIMASMKKDLDIVSNVETRLSVQMDKYGRYIDAHIRLLRTLMENADTLFPEIRKGIQQLEKELGMLISKPYLTPLQERTAMDSKIVMKRAQNVRNVIIDAMQFFEGDSVFKGLPERLEKVPELIDQILERLKDLDKLIKEPDRKELEEEIKRMHAFEEALRDTFETVNRLIVKSEKNLSHWDTIKREITQYRAGIEVNLMENLRSEYLRLNQLIRELTEKLNRRLTEDQLKIQAKKAGRGFMPLGVMEEKMINEEEARLSRVKQRLLYVQQESSRALSNLTPRPGEPDKFQEHYTS